MHYPKDPRTQIIGFLGPRYHKYYSICPLKPYDLGPWTLKEMITPHSRWDTLIGQTPRLNISGPEPLLLITATKGQSCLKAPGDMEPHARLLQKKESSFKGGNVGFACTVAGLKNQDINPLNLQFKTQNPKSGTIQSTVAETPLRVQVPDDHILTQDQY